MYKLELDRVIAHIKETKAKLVLLQLPDGMKQKSNKILDEVEKQADCEAFLLFGSCFGACDLPLGLDLLKIDLIVQWGHNKFNKEKW